MAVSINSIRCAVTTTRRQLIAAAGGVAAVAACATPAAASEPLEKLWADYQSSEAALSAALDAYERAFTAFGHQGARAQDRAADEALSARYRALDRIDQTSARTVSGAIIKLRSVHARASFNAGFNDGLGGYEFEVEAHKVAAVIRDLEALSGA